MPPKGKHHAHSEEVRLQIYLARSGIASRRHSEELIAAGRVTVNGETVTAPGTRVRPGVDEVVVDGQPVIEQPTTWIALHKPRGYVTTRIDPYGRKTVYELIPDKYQGLFHVGRLDRDSEGVLLLTNDGELANRMLHPSFGVTKEYWADVEGRPTSDELNQLTEGVEVEGESFRAESVRRLHQVDDNVFRIEVVLREGKKREVRRMMEAVGHPVKRLSRRRFGPVSVGELPSGKWRVVPPAELASVAAGKSAKKTRPRDADGEAVPAAEATGGDRPPKCAAHLPDSERDSGGTAREDGRPPRPPRREAEVRRPREAEGRGSPARPQRRQGVGCGSPRRRPEVEVRRSAVLAQPQAARRGSPRRPRRREGAG
jgi:23S rRNA pseudouridine2605 synthase